MAVENFGFDYSFDQHNVYSGVYGEESLTPWDHQLLQITYLVTNTGIFYFRGKPTLRSINEKSY